MNTTAIDERTVKELARKLWEKAGHPVGGPEKYRLEAARLLSVGQQTRKNQTADEAGKESFPASDPPASGLPDKPPVNADEKWDAAAKPSAPRKRRRRTTV